MSVFASVGKLIVAVGAALEFSEVVELGSVLLTEEFLAAAEPAW